MESTAVAAEGGATVHQAPRRGRGKLLWLLIVVACVTAADLLLKRGATSVAESSHWLDKMGIGALRSPYTVGGIVFHLAGLMAWLQALRTIPLTVAYCFTAAQQVTIALGAWFWLGDQITPLRWAGIGCVCAGVLVLVPAIAAAEADEPEAERAA